VEWSRPRPDAAVVDVSLAEDNLLVLAENCARGWKVWVDRVPAVLERVDLGLCAVRVAAGRHRVQVRYVPPGWPQALAGPLLALLGFALAGVARERRRVNRLPSESSPSSPSRPGDARSPPGDG
jgi:uncharacterized membrane protein YfhO